MGDFDAVPGFEAALERSPTAARAYEDLCWQLEGGPVTARRLALIAIAAAQHNACPYAAWIQRRAALELGISEEEIFLAAILCALDPREAAMLRFAERVMLYGEYADPNSFLPQLSILDIRAIVSAVTLVTLVNLVIEGLAPAGGRAIPAARDH